MKPEYLLVIAAASAGVYFAFKTKTVVKEAVHAVNPVNNNNVINSGVNAAFGLDNKTESLGTKAYTGVQNVKKWLGMEYDAYGL